MPFQGSVGLLISVASMSSRGRSQPSHFDGTEYIFLEGLKNQPNFFWIFNFYCLPKPEQINFGQAKSYADERKNSHAKPKNASNKFAPTCW